MEDIEKIDAKIAEIHLQVCIEEKLQKIQFLPMTPVEYIKELAEYIIPAVFKADEKLRPQLQKILAENANKETGAKLYCIAIASEIVGKMPDSAFDTQKDHISMVEEEYHNKMQ